MDVLILFVVLGVLAAAFIAWRARRPGPLPTTARTHSRLEDRREGKDPTLDRPAGPGAESEAVMDRGETGPSQTPPGAGTPPSGPTAVGEEAALPSQAEGRSESERREGFA